MSDPARPDLAAVEELATLVRHLADELASFRRRALVAEARVRELEEAAAATPGQLVVTGARVNELESDNAALRDRLGKAADRTQQLLDRVHFLRQQAQRGEP